MVGDESLAATGTGGPSDHQRYPQRYPQQLERDTARNGQHGATAALRVRASAERQSMPRATLRSTAHHAASPSDKATCGTRTRDLSFTKAPLYQLS